MADNSEREIAALMRKLETFARDLKGGAMVKDIAVAAKKQIVKRTRAGYGVDSLNTNSSKIEKLKLEPSSKKRRRNDKKRGVLTGKTTPAKANLTRTGSLLNKTHVRKITPNEYEIAVAPVDQEKAQHLADNGHLFLSLATKEFKQILKEAFAKLTKKLDKQ